MIQNQVFEVSKEKALSDGFRPELIQQALAAVPLCSYSKSELFYL